MWLTSLNIVTGKVSKLELSHRFVDCWYRLVLCGMIFLKKCVFRGRVDHCTVQEFEISAKRVFALHSGVGVVAIGPLPVVLLTSCVRARQTEGDDVDADGRETQ